MLACRAFSRSKFASAASSRRNSASVLSALTPTASPHRSSKRTNGALRFCACRRRADSTSNCRIARAAIRLKCKSDSHVKSGCAASFTHASFTSAVGFIVEAGSFRRTPAARRRNSSYARLKAKSSAFRSGFTIPIAVVQFNKA